jgi:hypothetical protein
MYYVNKSKSTRRDSFGIKITLHGNGASAASGHFAKIYGKVGKQEQHINFSTSQPCSLGIFPNRTPSDNDKKIITYSIFQKKVKFCHDFL